MAGETNLAGLLENMHPQLQDGKFVFITCKTFESVEREAVMIFRESEGITMIVREEAISCPEGDTPRWAMITLTVHSDLSAVGFLAAITEKLAEAGISVNAVSAYYHDHLFVPWEKREEAVKVLESFK